ncbi:1,25-dihydroxyvitamin D(3) 24-hydroxylase, mitochondrial-like [Glandiceps talaboti]
MSTMSIVHRSSLFLQRPGYRCLASAARTQQNVDDTVYTPAAGSRTIEKTIAEVKPYDAIPGPPGGITGFVVGMYQALLKDGIRKPWEMMGKLRDQYGPITKSGMGAFRTVGLYDPKDVETVLRQEGKYPRRLEFTPWVAYREHRGRSNGVLLVDGVEWHRNRSALSKRLLRPKAVVAYADTVNSVVTDLVDRLKRKTEAGDDFVIEDLENDLFKYAMDAAGSVMFDQRLNLLDDRLHPEAEAFIRSVHVIFEEFIYLILIPTKYHKMLNTKHWRKHTEAWDIIFDHAKKLIDEKLAKIFERLKNEDVTEDEADFLTYLVLQGKINTEEIYANTTELLAAAVDTTSNTTLWSMYELANNPEIQQRLFEEIESVVPTGVTPNPSHLNQMPYLKSVVKETLRLYPAALSVSRRLDHDIVIKGYNIPAGEVISCQVVTMCRDPNIFKDPMTFKPERWLREDSDSVHAFAALVFGFGPRMCLGRRLAELEMHLLLARICRTFKLENTKQVEPVMTSLITPSEPTRMKFTPRN